jgi:hypothetical protein
MAEEYRLTAQSMQGEAPVSALCLPAWHALHGRPSRPMTLDWYPARHLQSSSASLRAGADVKAGHISHCAAPAAE